MTDTHTHIYMPDSFPDGGVTAVERAIAAGVCRMVFPCVDLSSIPDMRTLHSRFPDNTRLAIGLHPTELTPDWREILRQMHDMLPGDFAAIGEVGIDLYHDDSLRAEQCLAFADQLLWASEFHLPVIIHCRNGLDDTLRIIAEHPHPLPPLIFHSFTGSKEDVERIRTVCDPWFGINGVVTFKNAPALREALPVIGLDHILLETDAPWLAPVPVRGTLNESSRIPHICQCIAETLALPMEQVEEITDRAAAHLFSFKNN